MPSPPVIPTSSYTLDPRIPTLVPGFDAPFFQAGLAGYSDGAMRLIARRHGCPYCVTEALLDQTLINGGKGRRREDPDLLAQGCGSGTQNDNQAAGQSDHPLAGQIIGTEPEEMGEGAAILVKMGYEVIDVNLACPVKKLRRKSRGGHFLAQPEEALAVLRAVREAVPEEIPTTVKLRRAFDDSPEMTRNFEQIFEGVYELGYGWATVHCRTVQQKYEGPGRWDFLTNLTRRYPDRLIFGSGDIWIAPDIFRMIEETGVHAVAVARGCIGNPWIFRQARQLLEGDPVEEIMQGPSVPEQREVLHEHFQLSARLHSEGGAGRMMRKFGIKFSHHHPQPEVVKAEFVRCKSMADWQGVLERHYQNGDHHP